MLSSRAPKLSQPQPTTAVAHSRPLSIWLLARSLEVGGAERQLVGLARGLVERGHSVKIALFYRRGGLVEEAERAGIQIIDLRKSGRWDVAGFLGRTVAELRRSRPDIVYSFLGGANVVAALARPFAPGPKLVWSILNSARDPSVDHVAARLAFRLESALSRSAHSIIANSRAGRSFAIRRGFPAGRIAIVPNGIDTDRFRRDADLRTAERRRLGIGDDEVAVGVLARLNSTKGYPDFLSAARLVSSRIPDARFLCVGAGEERAALEQQARKLGIGDRVTFTGELDPVAALNAFDIACSPSVTEGFSNSIAEAMSCGLPCIVTDVGDSAMLVGETGTVVPPSSFGALADAIERQIARLHDHDPAASRARIVENFSLAAMADRTVDAFSAVLKGGSR